MWWPRRSNYWWTRARIAFLCVLLHALFFAVVASSASSAAVGAAVMLGIDSMIVALFAVVARGVGRWHAEMRSREAFLQRIWNSEWNETWWGAGPTRSGGKSFYRRLLAEDAAHRDALYGALAAREAERLLHPASVPGFALSVMAPSLLAVSAAEVGILDQVGLFGLVLPLTGCLLLDTPLDLLGRRSMLRSRAVERATVLLPRDVPVDGPLIDRWSQRMIIVALAVFVAIPVAFVAALLYFKGGQEAQHFVATVIRATLFVVAVAIPYQLAIRFIHERVPFTKFPGPVSVSVLLDIESRVRYTLSAGMGMYGIFVLGSLLFGASNAFGEGFGVGVLGAEPMWILLYALGLFDDQADGPIFYPRFEQIRTRLNRALQQIEAAR